MELDRVQVRFGWPGLVLRHACPNATRLYPNDGLEWHRFALTFANKAFQASLVLDTWLSSFASFLDELKILDRDVKGSARLSTTEGDLRLEGTVDKLGHIKWDGRLRHPGPEPESTLEFSISDDQTSLRRVIAEFESVIAEARREPSPSTELDLGH